MNYRSNSKTARWAFVAGTTFILDALFFYFLFKILDNVSTSNLMSFLFSTCYNFFMHKHWTYEDSVWPRLPFRRYLALLITSIIINSSLIHIFLYFMAAPLLSKILASIITVPLNYVGLRSFVFKKSN
jgi:putative flippase GtrA